MHPAGKLRRSRPPYQNLEEWVRRRIRPIDPKQTAYRIAKYIGKHGIEPNEYIRDSMREARPLIQQAAADMDRDIIIDMENLPYIPIEDEL